jgi:hypothetical protein
MNKKLLIGMFALFFVFLSIQSVYAIDILNSVLQPFRGTDVGQLYNTYSLFIDAVLYLLLFLGLAQLIYVKIYGKKEGKLVAIALALTFAMALLESRTGFRLSQLMPIGAIILMFVLFILLYNLFEGMFNDKGASFSLAFLIMYGFMMSTFSPLYNWLETNAPLLAALVQIAMVVSFVVLIIKLIGMFKGSGSSDGGGGGSESGSTPKPKTPTPTEPNKITLTSPSNHQHFNAGDYIRIAFEVSGPDLMKDYDYEVRLDNAHFAARVPNVHGNQVWPFPTRAGAEIPAGRHALHAVAFKRRWLSGGSNKIITQSNVIEIDVGPGGGGGGGGAPPDLVGLITNNFDTAITQLNNKYQRYALIFGTIIQMHYDAFRTGNPAAEPTATEWAALITARDEMLHTAAEVNTILTAIHSHAGYGTLTAVHLGILAANVTRNTRIRRAIIQFEIQARTDYNTHSAPRAPPRP